MTNTEPYRGLSALVVGLGSIGARHLANLQALGLTRLGVVRRRNLPPSRPLNLSRVEVFADLDQALAAGWDLAFIANPTALHLPAALACARAGCHLYLEKPVSHQREGLDELVREVEDRRLVVQVGCQLRCDPGLMAVREWLLAGEVGPVVGATAEAGEWLPGWHPWEDYRSGYAARADLGGGVLLTTIHDLDYLLWLLGPLTPLAATGGGSGALELDVEDHVWALLVTAHGAGVGLTLDYLQRPAARRLKLVGGRGVIVWDYYAGLARLWREGEPKAQHQRPADWDRNHLFLAIVRDFLAAVTQGREPLSPLSQGLAALELALALKAMLPDQPGRQPGV